MGHGVECMPGGNTVLNRCNGIATQTHIPVSYGHCQDIEERGLGPLEKKQVGTSCFSSFPEF